MALDLDSNDAGRDWLKPHRLARVVAESGGLYLLSLDGTADERAVGVVYDRAEGRVSHEATLASHLRFMHGYSRGFGGTVEERERIELEARALLAGQPLHVAPTGLLEASIGNGLEGYYAVRGDGVRVEYQAPREEPVELYPSPEAWEAFRATIREVRVWTWESVYEADGEITDGDYWAVCLEDDGRTVRSSGANAFPPSFGAFRRAVETLVGGRTFR